MYNTLYNRKSLNILRIESDIERSESDTGENVKDTSDSTENDE